MATPRFDTTTDFRVWHIPQVPGRSFHVQARSYRAAVDIADTLARYDAFLYEQRIRADYDNSGGIEFWNAAEHSWEPMDEPDVEEYLHVLADAGIEPHVIEQMTGVLQRR